MIPMFRPNTTSIYPHPCFRGTESTRFTTRSSGATRNAFAHATSVYGSPAVRRLLLNAEREL